MQKILVFNLTPRFWMLHYSAQFCNALAKKYQVSVAIADYYKGDLYDKGINLVKIKTNPDLKSFLFDSLNIIQHIKFFCKIHKLKPDIIHFIDNHPRYIIYAPLLKLLGYQIITTQHDPILHSGDCKGIKGKIAVFTNTILRKFSDTLVVHGQHLRSILVDEFKLAKDKIKVVPHGNYNFFTRRSDGKTKPIKNTFLFFGRIVDYKGLDLLLESLEFVKKYYPDFSLIIAGEGDISPYQDMLKKYNSNILLYNWDIPDEEVYQYFERSQFVVLPYKDATWSGVIPLAFAFSKAVLVNNVWELASVTNKAWWGIVLNSFLPQKLWETIVWMLEHPKEVLAMGLSGRKYTKDALWWDLIVKIIYS